LRGKIVEFVGRGDLGLASGRKPDGGYERVWFQELIAPDEVAFEPDVLLLRKARAEALKTGAAPAPLASEIGREPAISTTSEVRPSLPLEPATDAKTTTIHLVGTVPAEVWNRLGTRILPKLRTGSELKIGLECSVTVKGDIAQSLVTELRQVLQELGLGAVVRVE
jgi:hypothetical protein